MAATDHAYGYALVVLAPEIARSLGLPISAVAGLTMFRAVTFFVSGGLVAAALRRRPIADASLATAAACVRVAALLLTGLVATPWALVSGVTLYGLAGVSTPFAHSGLLESAYGRSEAVAAFHRSSLRIGNAVVAGAIAPVVVISPSHWPTVFVLLGAISALGPLGALLVQSRSQPSVAPRPGPEVPVVPEAVQSLLGRRAARPLLVAFAVGGLFEVPLYVYAFGGLSTRWSVDAPSRAAVAAVFELLGVVVGALAVRRRLWRKRPHKATAAGVVGAAMLAGAGVLVASAAVHRLGGYVTLLGLGMGLLGFMAPLLFAGTVTMLPPLRNELWGALPTTTLLVVAAAGSAALAWVAATFGDQAAVACFAAPTAVLGLMIIVTAWAREPMEVPAWWSRWPLPATADG